MWLHYWRIQLNRSKFCLISPRQSRFFSSKWLWSKFLTCGLLCLQVPSLYSLFGAPFFIQISKTCRVLHVAVLSNRFIVIKAAEIDKHNAAACYNFDWTFSTVTSGIIQQMFSKLILSPWAKGAIIPVHIRVNLRMRKLAMDEFRNSQFALQVTRGAACRCLGVKDCGL